jgi:hypothetical protein
MVSLPSLLLVAAWLATVFAVTHPEAVATRTLIARTDDPNHLPNLPTLAPASYCQEVPNGKGDVVWHTKTGPCTYNTLRGDVTQVGTDWIQLKPTDGGPARSERSDRLQPTDLHREDFTQVDTVSVGIKPTDTGLAENQGERSAKPTPTRPSGHNGDSGLPVPSASGVAQQGDIRCSFEHEKMDAGDGKWFWGIADGQPGQLECNDYCATQLVAAKAEGRLGSASCSRKNNNQPFVDHNGDQLTGS